MGRRKESEARSKLAHTRTPLPSCGCQDSAEHIVCFNRQKRGEHLNVTQKQLKEYQNDLPEKTKDGVLRIESMCCERLSGASATVTAGGHRDMYSSITPLGFIQYLALRNCWLTFLLTDRIEHFIQKERKRSSCIAWCQKALSSAERPAKQHRRQEQEGRGRGGGDGGVRMFVLSLQFWVSGGHAVSVV